MRWNVRLKQQMFSLLELQHPDAACLKPQSYSKYLPFVRRHSLPYNSGCEWDQQSQAVPFYDGPQIETTPPMMVTAPAPAPI